MVSVAGPMLEIRFITLLTAFGVAILKAYLVARYFMHLGVERRWVGYLLLTMVALMLVMVGGVAPDVLRHEGARWQNVAAKAAVERGEELNPMAWGSAQTPAAPPGSAGRPSECAGRASMLRRGRKSVADWWCPARCWACSSSW